VEVHSCATVFEGRPAVMGTLLDITDRKRSEAQIVEQALNDPLTRLPNRIRFMERLESELAQARRHARKLAVVYLDLDGFKFINDNWGHSIGDSLLQSLALRLKRSVREVDTVARIGGDEFVILMPDVRRTDDMSGVAQKLLSAVDRPFQLEGKTLQVTTSIGVALYPEDGENAEGLLRNADAAMYRAKDLGRNSFQLCTPELTALAVERLGLQNGLQAALDEEQLFVEYQPIVSLQTGRTVALEALARWQHPHRGLVSPATFIPVAEETGMILAVGEWVLRSACRQLAEWHRTGLPELRIAVNFSARQFRERSLVHVVQSALTEANLEPRHLEAEITESVAMEGAEIVVANLNMLRSIGVGISIDDFGTGYSAMSYLKRYPVTTLKIDRSFVMDLATNPADAGIVRAIVEMAHGSQLGVIAEGVETKEQFQHLQQYGCDEMQGFWVSQPMGIADAGAFLQKERDLWEPREGG
jgi:diguanylate cyclase (GGDEF)-like protein